MKRAGVPVIPGSDGAVRTLEEAEEAAEKIGFPLLVKASAGGGGRGIRMVESREQLAAQITAAQSEAKSFFGDEPFIWKGSLKIQDISKYRYLPISRGTLYIWESVTAVCSGVIRRFLRKAPALL